MKSDDRTESMVSPHDACDTTRIVLPGPLLPPAPRVLQRQADDLAFCAPETLAAKLRAIGYREPILPVPSLCAVDGCGQMTHTTICFDCATEIEWMAREEEDRKSRRKASAAFWPALILVLAMLAGLFFCASQLGAWLRWAVS